MKKILCILLAVILAISLVACVKDGEGIDPEGGDTPTISENADEFSYDSNGLYEKFGKTYHVKYKYTFYTDGEEAEGYEVEIVKTVDKMTYTFLGVQMEYRKENGGYHQYLIAEGEETLKLSEEPISEEEVDSIAKDSLSLASYYDTIDTTTFKKAGTATVAGRTCDKFVGQYKYLDYSYKENIFIDKATGACLKVNVEVGAEGVKSGAEFEALIFKIN